MRPARHPSNPHRRLLRLVEAGKFDDAQQEAIKLAGKYPQDAGIWYTLAGLHARQGQLKEVISCCRRVISLEPRHADAYFNLATALGRTGQDDEAESAFRKCLQIAPEHLPALMSIGNLLNRTGRHSDAITCFNHAAKAVPGDPEVFYCLGLSQQAFGRIDDAMNAYKKTIHLRPDHFKAINNLGHLLTEQGRLNEALEIFTRLVQLKPDSPEACNNLGIVYDSMGKVDEAETAYRKAITLNPSFIETRSHLGFLLADEGRTREAIECFEDALNMAPTCESAIAGKAVALEKLGKLDAALAILEPAITGNTSNPDIVLAFSTIMLHKGDPDPAIKIARQLLAAENIPPKGAADLNFALGDLYEKTGDYTRAFSHYKKANDISPCTYDHKKHVQYIDRIIRATGKDSISKLPVSPCQDAFGDIIFIIGMPRSGTSLIEQILASHADVFGAGELRYMGDIASSFTLAEGKIVTYPADINSLTQTDIDSMAQYYTESVRKISGGSRIITDKMPHNFLYLGLISLLSPGARVIHVNRTPIDNCLSLYFHGFNPMHSYTTRLEYLGQYYLQYLRLMDHWRSTINIPILDIRYEDLVDDLENSTRQLLGFCGLEWSEDCLNFHNNNRFVKTPSYNQVRSPIYSSSVERWKHYRAFIDPLQSALEEGDK